MSRQIFGPPRCVCVWGPTLTPARELVLQGIGVAVTLKSCPIEEVPPPLHGRTVSSGDDLSGRGPDRRAGPLRPQHINHRGRHRSAIGDIHGEGNPSDSSPSLRQPVPIKRRRMDSQIDTRIRRPIAS